MSYRREPTGLGFFAGGIILLISGCTAAYTETTPENYRQLKQRVGEFPDWDKAAKVALIDGVVTDAENYYLKQMYTKLVREAAVAQRKEELQQELRRKYVAPELPFPNGPSTYDRGH